MNSLWVENVREVYMTHFGRDITTSKHVRYIYEVLWRTVMDGY